VGLYYQFLFAMPAFAAAISLWLAMQAGVLRRPVLFVAWFLVAAFCQWRGMTFSPVWATGLVLHVVLAVYLQLKLRLET
jgi:hypothetical protein